MTITAITALLLEDITLAQEVLELIEQELQALTQSDLAELQKILETKKPKLAQMALHAKKRSDLLLEAGFPATPEGLSLCAQHTTPHSNVLECAEQLATLIAECQQKNLRNGRLIHANQATTSHLLGLLRGNDSPTLYDSSGSTAKIGRHRPLSQA